MCFVEEYWDGGLMIIAHFNCLSVYATNIVAELLNALQIL